MGYIDPDLPLERFMLGTRRAFTSALATVPFILSAGGLAQQAAAQGKDVVILAAASLKNALDEASAAWTRQTGKTTRISYAASSALARQIEGGIPADIFISADVPWMDYVAERKLIKSASRSNFLGNEIVLVAGKDSRIDLRIDKGFNLRGALGNDGRLAMGNVDAVPAGRYGKAALEYLGVWASVSDRVALAENVRMALTLVSRGEAPLGIVYKTDAASDPAVRIVGAFPADSHPAIIYPMALLASSTNPDAQALVDYLKMPAASPFFEKQGFTVLK
jgi:molybdate transport system substrate-binding protein